MLFSSIPFLFYFLPLFLLCYFAVPSQRNWVLLVFSIFFYGWGEFRYLPLLFAFIAVNWVIGIALEPQRAARRATLTLGIAFNVSLLLVFKYWDFVIAQLNAIAASFGQPPFEAPSLPLVLGVSFFAFQGISYLVDVFRGTVQAQRGLLKFATYKAMFPPLLAGPVVRYAEVANDLGRRPASMERIRLGFSLFILGLAQKSLIADTVATTSDAVFGMDPALLGAPTAWAGVVAYTIQIYFDFAGYSNMAIGLGHLIGFKLPRNFDRPYVSRSVTEFWRRWHMTLSSWFRDYVYIPLGGNRRGSARTYFNLLVVFLLCGLWHGANWTFVAWGACHGLLLVVERVGLAKLLSRAWRPVQHAYLLAAIALTWVLFRASSLEHAAQFLRAMFVANEDGVSLAQVLNAQGLIAIVFGACCAVVPLPKRAEFSQWLRNMDTQWRPAASISVRAGSYVVLMALLILSVITLAAATYRPFIYFRF
jgi:alginate O-acetyltransferase complex protein AlgI